MERVKASDDRDEDFVNMFAELGGILPKRRLGFYERKIATPKRLEWVAIQESKCRGLVERRFSHSD